MSRQTVFDIVVEELPFEQQGRQGIMGDCFMKKIPNPSLSKTTPTV